MLVNDIFITNMPIFMDSLLWINKRNSNFQQLSLRRIETVTLYSIVQNLMIIISAKKVRKSLLKTRAERLPCEV